MLDKKPVIDVNRKFLKCFAKAKSDQMKKGTTKIDGNESQNRIVAIDLRDESLTFDFADVISSLMDE